ncbi:MAG: STAS domain-containing protein [Spirochaetia bacterium]|nr:STAS domain-containing protein [Spirochaetia bacterium]
MEIKKNRRPDAHILELTGRFDIGDTDFFESMFEEAAKSQPSTIALDMTGLHYIASAGIAALIGVRKIVKEYGGTLVLFGMNPLVLNVLRFGTMDNFFRLLSLEEFDAKYPK